MSDAQRKPPCPSAESEGVLSPDEAMARLERGNARFALGTMEHPRAGESRRKETAQRGQSPAATVLACSDSREPVELLFDQGIGDLFVIRVAGNICNADAIGSIEYSVDHLGVPLVVVLGHSQCGAVSAAAGGGQLEGHLGKLVDSIRPALEEARSLNPRLEGEALVSAAVEANIWQAIERLMINSPSTTQRIAAGTLKVVGAVYDIAEGTIRWLGPHPDEKRLLHCSGDGDGE